MAIYTLLSSSPSKAWKEVRIALKAYPKSERIQFVAGLVLVAQGKKNEARKHFANAINLGTQGPDAHINLALASAETGQPEKACSVLDRADERFPNNLQVMLARVHVLRSAGDLAQALEVTNAIVDQHPEAEEPLDLQGILLSENGRLLDAITALEKLLQKQPDHVAALTNLGRFYAFTNQPEKALEVTSKAYALAGDKDFVIENLAIRRRECGDLEGATQLFWHLIDISPSFAPEACRQLSDIIPDTELARLAADIDAVARTARSTEARAHLEFARAILAKRQNDTQQFSGSLKRANRLMSKTRPYDANRDSDFHRMVRERFTEEAPASLSFPEMPAIPIFIMGLPRSGTTLLERMLSAAPGIVGLGEVALINRYFGERVGSDGPFADGLVDLRAEYTRYQNAAGRADWTVDKMPANYIHAGWINRVFPEAKLIMLRRDRRDVALSMFEAYFDNAGQNFAFDENGIAHRLSLFEETVSDWLKHGVEFLEIDYEDLVRTPAEILQRIADYCGIQFDAVMLHPEANTASIRTASSQQARQGINKNSIARWQKYPDMLPKIFDT